MYAFSVNRVDFFFLSRPRLRPSTTYSRETVAYPEFLILARLGVIVVVPALHRRRRHRCTCACRASSRHLARFECLRALPRGSGANDAQRGHSALLPFYASSIIPAKVIHPPHVASSRPRKMTFVTYAHVYGARSLHARRPTVPSCVSDKWVTQ